MVTSNADGVTYQWIDCNGNVPISGAQGQSYQPLATGSFAVIVTLNGCSDTSTCSNIKITGINQISYNSIQLYPNPTEDLLTIDFGPISNSLQLELTDVSGRLVLEPIEVTSNIVTLNLVDLSKGVYLLRVTNKAQSNIFKIIKE